MSLDSYRQFINRNLPLPERGCTCKAVYFSRREASSQARRGRGMDGALKPYHCRWCDRWHLGHRHGARR